jgi:hypothetical protein
MGFDSQGIHLVPFSTPGGSLPLPLGVFFGRNKLIGEIIGLVDHLESISLIWRNWQDMHFPTILHDDRIKQRFGNCR